MKLNILENLFDYKNSKFALIMKLITLSNEIFSKLFILINKNNFYIFYNRFIIRLKFVYSDINSKFNHIK